MEYKAQVAVAFHLRDGSCGDTDVDGSLLRKAWQEIMHVNFEMFLNVVDFPISQSKRVQNIKSWCI